MPFTTGRLTTGRLTTGRRPRGAAALLLALAGGAPAALRPAALRAQVVLGAGDDATLPAPGEVRGRVTANFNSATSRLGGVTGTGGGRVPLASEYSTDALGPTQFPTLGPVRDTLRAITGQAALGLSLGTVRVVARTSTAVVPTLVEYGIARRLAVAVTIPGVTTSTSVGIDANAGGGSGNFGLNPLRDASTASATASRNAAALTNLDTAITRLRAQGAASAALAADAQRFRDGLATVYGTGGTGTGARPGAVVVPLAGSDAQAAVAARLAQLAARGAPLSTTALPAASTSRIGTSAFLALLTSTELGIGSGAGVLAPLGSYRRSGPGDVDAVVNLNFLDTFGGSGRLGVLRARVAPARGVRLRSTVGAGWRFGLGSGRSPFLLFDVPPSERMSAVLARSATDVAVGRRFSASVVARLAAPVGDRVTLRVADAGQPYAPSYRLREVARRLGREVELEVTPRYALNGAFAVFGQGFVRDRAAARYTGTFTATDAETGVGEVTFDAASLGVGTGGRETRAGFGVAYSTVAGVARGRGRLPVELSYLHSFLAAASGGNVLNVTTEQLSLRLGVRLFGR